MKGAAHGFLEILFVRDLAGATDVVISESPGEQTIVRADEGRFICLYGDGATFTAYAGVNYGDVDAILREIRCGSHQRKGTGANIARGDFMGDIDYVCAWFDAENDTFHGADEPIAGAEICGQGDDAHGWNIIAERAFETNIVLK